MNGETPPESLVVRVQSGTIEYRWLAGSWVMEDHALNRKEMVFGQTVELLDEIRRLLKETRFLRAKETDDLRTTVAMLWDLMTDDQCIRFSAISPIRYEAVQDLWRKWADRQGER